ncbi:pre-mRNA-splicing factor Cwf21 [Pseudohyphozyma bogoriensis]|nr:pre-mRNA-splicing factor Cwf21 [Pseudohyphozyma bogoriensis]
MSCMFTFLPSVTLHLPAPSSFSVIASCDLQLTSVPSTSTSSCTNTTDNGVGLSTARGSGTNGHIQRNLSNLRPRERFDDRNAQSSKDLYTHRAPDKDILEHERKRRVEVKCLELQVSLEDDGVAEEEIEKQVQALREKLLAVSEGQSGKERTGEIKSWERHELGQAKQVANERLRMAMGISKDHVEGLAFDQEAQARIKVEKAQERERAREERARIQVQLEADRAKANREREALQAKQAAELKKMRDDHERNMRSEKERLEADRQRRVQDEFKEMDRELDERRAGGGRSPRGFNDRDAPPHAAREGSYDRPAPTNRARPEVSVKKSAGTISGKQQDIK